MTDAQQQPKTGDRTVQLTIGLIIVVSTYMYIHEQLTRQHLLDVLLAVLAFGVGLIFLYRHYK